MLAPLPLKSVECRDGMLNNGRFCVDIGKLIEKTNVTINSRESVVIFTYSMAIMACMRRRSDTINNKKNKTKDRTKEKVEEFK